MESLARSQRSFFSRVLTKIDRLFSSLFRGRRFAQFGAGSYVGKPFLLSGLDAVKVGRKVTIWKMARIEALKTSPSSIVLNIGDETVIHPFVHIAAAHSVEIGTECLFASGVYISDHDHNWQDVNTPTLKKPGLTVGAVKIGNGVWLGERAMILKGVTIGEGSVIAAGSVVSKDIPARCVAGGVPAKVLKIWDEKLEEWVKA
ncbi:acyltransferase [Sneathiella aquimaris]|uniref:acyltransferase n=1 Tax=Sneathiella aquimaris TaxID=2599305 RepID=UPI00146E93FC|nr:acyltransferase [Sneathiella aquimaris]